MGRFLRAPVCHLSHSLSDHCPLLIDSGLNEMRRNRNEFIFEAWWTIEDSFQEKVHNLWCSDNDSILMKLERLQRGLTQWSKRIKFKRVELKTCLTK